MTDYNDIELVIKSRIPLIVIESHEESRVVDMMRQIAINIGKPVFKWSITEGLERIDRKMAPQKHNSEPTDVLGHIKAVKSPGLYILTDFHPYLDEPVHVRLLKDIAIEYEQTAHTIVLVSHQIKIPAELAKFSAHTQLALPTKDHLERMVRDVAKEWAEENRGHSVKTDPKTLGMLVNNLSGLTIRDAKRLARNAVYDDGAITQSDLPNITKAKYNLLSQNGVLSFEYDTARFSDIGGFIKLKKWLTERRDVFYGKKEVQHLDTPKGVMLLGVQGCGKSLAAKAVAGTWGVPLLRLGFGTMYNKFHGETERNLRESLKTAEVMMPCVLWIDEIEKGIGTSDSDGGASRRVLGTLLTWMAEKKSAVFIVATANDIEALPPELVRKGRFDEIFFVDLPNENVRETIFSIHLKNRDLDPQKYDVKKLSTAANGFSGAEIEQAVVSAYYSAHAQDAELAMMHLLDEIRQTRPLSIVMAEKIDYLRNWAADRTVPCD